MPNFEIDTTPIKSAIELQRRADATLRAFSDQIAGDIAAKARALGSLTENTGTIDLPGGYRVVVVFSEARLKWPSPFLPSADKLQRDINAGWLDEVSDHLAKSHKTKSKPK